MNDKHNRLAGIAWILGFLAALEAEAGAVGLEPDEAGTPGSESQVEVTTLDANGLNEIARKEGWLLIDADSSGFFEIERDDEASVFESDGDAMNHVVCHALSGSEVHRQALLIHLIDAPKIARLG